MSLKRESGCSPNCRRITEVVCRTFLSALNSPILDCRDTARPSRPARRNSQRTTSSRQSWQQTFGNFEEITIWIISFDCWETSCCAIDSVAAFAWIHWIQIVPFALGAASVERWFFQKWKEYAKDILPFLHAAERDSWHHLVTDDESWYFFDTSPRRMWTLSRDDVATKPR
jgi:hypothetical protein